MAIINKFCPKCMNIIRKKDTKCSQCGMPVEEMQTKEEKKDKPTDILKEIKEQKKKVKEKEPKFVEAEKTEILVEEHNIEEPLQDNEQTNVEEIIEEKESKEDKDDSSYFDEEDIGKVVFENKNEPKRHKHRKKLKKEDRPNYTVDEDGSYNIDTKDVTFLEDVEKPTPSIKKARGDYEQEKLKWWEIYKWADRMLAKRKINKEVNKASRKRPEGVSKGGMIAWCIFFGWLGIHNFYGGNKKKGWTVVVLDAIVTLVMSIDVLYNIMGIFVGGGGAFVVLALWITDLFGICFNKYKYRISKEEFISNLNVETRAKLGKKFINLDRKVFKEKEEKRLAKKNKKRIKKQEKLNKRLKV